MSIELRFKAIYKSINGLGNIQLPDFTVITGLNGSGKTHLLEAIFHSSLIVKVLDGEYELENRKMKYVQHGSLRSEFSGTAKSYGASPRILEKYEEYKKKSKTKRSPIETFLVGSDIKLIKAIASEAKKDLENLSPEDFHQHYPIDDGSIANDIFRNNLSALFKRYHLKYDNNSYKEYRYKKYGEGAYLKEPEFLEKYGPPPWELVNKVFEECRFDYRINNPSNLHRDIPFSAKLFNQISGIEIEKFSDLSSGEQIIFSLAISLFNHRSNLQVDFPKLLLVDEPDSSLHPSMTKQLLDVVQNVLLRERGIKVIMTTHSPSTVALSPENSIYLMQSVEPRLIKTTKDKALSTLTSGVPTLSVNYENRRQVFVESKYDQSCYELIYKKISAIKPSEVSLNFLCAGADGSSGCDQVKELVSKLSEFGNTQVFGIIDWDGRNTGNNRLKVLGQGKRHSIENYVFDPLMIALYLIRENIENKDLYGFSENQSYFDAKDFSEQGLQKIVDTFISKIESLKDGNASEELEACSTFSGKVVNIPKWYLCCRGHDVEAKVKQVFPPLQCFRNEGSLKKDIIQKVFYDLPGFIPLDLLDIIESIRNG